MKEEDSLINESDSNCSLKEQLIKFYVEGNPMNLVERDELFFSVAEFVVLTQSCSISVIQREFSLGLCRTKQILDQIESAGIISHFRTDEGRKVLIKDKISLGNLIVSLPNVEIKKCLDKLDLFYEKNKQEIETKRREHELLQTEELKKSESEALKLMKLEKILRKRLPAEKRT